MYEVRIDIPALFAECIDQTLLDYRNRVNERGQDMAEAETLEPSLADIFTVNLRSMAAALQLVLRRVSAECWFHPPELIYRLREIEGVANDTLAVTVKDALKYGMLCWWYKSRDGQLYQLYTLEYDKAEGALRREIIGSHMERPYRMF